MKKFPCIYTKRLELIEIQQNHLHDIYKLYSNTEVTKYYNINPFTNIQEAQKTIDLFQNRFNDNTGIRWGISLKDKKNIIGTLGYNNLCKNHRASIGYDLEKTHWNQGYITEALNAIINYGFTELEINRIEAEVMQGNINSEKVLEKLNFTKEGVLREWMLWNGTHYDMSMFSLLKSENEK